MIKPKPAWTVHAVYILCLLAVIVGTYDFNKKARTKEHKKETSIRKQMAEHLWTAGHLAAERGNELPALHLDAEALTVSPDPVLDKTLAMELSDYWNIFPLEHKIEHDGSPDGILLNRACTRMLAWDTASIATLWDISGKEPKPKKFEHMKSVDGAVFNQDETRILTWGFRGTVRLWDAETGEPVTPPMMHKKRVRGACFDSTETRVLSWSEDGTARLWNAQTGAPLTEPMTQEGAVMGARFDPQEKRVLTWGFDNDANIWNARTGTLMVKLVGHQDSIRGATFNADGTRVLTWSKDCTARLWDAFSGKPAGTPFRDMTSQFGIRKAGFNTDETRIFTHSDGHPVSLWDAASGKLVKKLGASKGEVRDGILNPNGQQIFTWGAGGAYLWDTREGELLEKLDDRKNRAVLWKFNTDGSRLLSLGHIPGQALKVWDSKTLTPIGMPAVACLNPFYFGFSEDGSRLVAASAFDTVIFRNISKEAPFENCINPSIQFHSITGAVFNASGTRFLKWGRRNSAEIRDTDTGTLVAELKGHTGDILGARFNPDETLILTWGRDKTARTWDAQKGTAVVKLAGHEDAVQGAVFSAGGMRVVTFSTDNSVRIWNVKTGAQISMAKIPIASFNDSGSAVFNANGTRILTWNNNPYAEIFDTGTGKRLKRFKSGGAEIVGAAFNADASIVLTWSSDFMVDTWDAESGKRLTHSRQNFHRGMINKDGTRACSWQAYSNSGAWILDTWKGSQVGNSLYHGAETNHAAFNRDESFILTCSRDCTVRLWDVRGARLLKTLKVPGAERFTHTLIGMAIDAQDTRVLAWSDEDEGTVWDISVDYDFPKELLKLQAMALTGTEYKPVTGRVATLSSDRWRSIRDEYMEAAREHYKHCCYKEANVYRKLNLEEIWGKEGR